MFEQPTTQSEKDRSRTIMILSGLAILAVLVLIIAVTSLARKPAQTEFAYAGALEFDSYAGNLAINNVEKFHGERITGRYVRIQGKVENTGDRAVIALQLKATVIGTGGQLIREKIITPVPSTRDELNPGEAMRVEVSLEGVPEPWEIRDVTIELHSLKVK